MSDRTTLHYAYVLHTRAYQETSLIVELLTQEGRISAVAKGAKRLKSPFRGIIQPFIPLQISFSGRHELKTLTHAEMYTTPYIFTGDYLLAAFYVNELLMRLTLKESPCERLFDAYEMILRALREQEDLWVCLRVFEKSLLKVLGYELNLTHDAHTGSILDANAQYLYCLEKGPLRIEEGQADVSDGYIFSGATLLALADNNLADPVVKKQAKQLLRQALQLYLGPRPLKTRDLFFCV